ncbi:lysozyme inhibitor LprI family protein [Yersinia kristensenii]|uniref:lysozyme inhibitor LprI family protein n=1 Tax=Yersinia kristensenii TaxID=28152 RepID=UPI00119ED6C6|nr:lysozyme inhibitor LprI family protein [Yersinia kristensenii]MBW5811656.1 DUF1311 domain-containing protein [Yersinia kristensenii]MBW5828918.1 DUF1311 domain-containing protein [Yersinia kristensenii]MDA5490165.1 DUF1311 domain-containing protein [Yersinia kristensenii]
MKKILLPLFLLPFLSYADIECKNIQSSNQIYLCSKQSLEKNDANLNREYKKLLSIIDSEYVSHEDLKNEYINKIKSSQRAWVNFRDKNCEVFSYQIDVGTQAYETSINSCKDKMTQERIKELLSILNQ